MVFDIGTKTGLFQNKKKQLERPNPEDPFTNINALILIDTSDILYVQADKIIGIKRRSGDKQCNMLWKKL